VTSLLKQEMALVPDMLAHAARDMGARTAIEDIARGKEWSYRALNGRADAVAGALIRRNVEPGEAVAVLSQNRAEWLELLFGCGRAGITLVPIPATASRAEAISIFTHTAPRLLFFGSCLEEKAFSLAGPDMGLVSFDEPGEDGYEAFLSEGLGTRGRDQHPARECWYVVPRRLTDGTQELITISHEAAFLNALVLAPMAELRSADRHMPLLPFATGEGLSLLALPHLAQGGRLIMVDPSDTDLTLDVLASGRIDTLSSHSAYLDLIEGHPRGALVDLSLIRYWALSGGERLPPVAEALRRRGAMLAHAHFLPDAGGPFLIERNEGLDGPLTSRSHPHLSVELRGLDGAPLNAGEPGELLVSGRILSDGLLVHQALEPLRVAIDGWRPTGWLAAHREAGGLMFFGRQEEAFQSAGARVVPAEVEDLMRTHPAIADVVVIGIENNQLGKVGRAYFATRPGHEVSRAGLRAFLTERIAAHKVPREFYECQAIARDPSGRIQRNALTGTPLK
jgi:fatty-acyl-CoA synthase